VRPGKTRFILIVCAFAAVVLGATPALAAPTHVAYLDPGTGSYMFQVVVGAVLGVAVSVKLMWKRAWARVSRRSDRDPRPKDS